MWSTAFFKTTLRLPAEFFGKHIKTQYHRLLLMSRIHILHRLAQIVHCLNRLANLNILIGLESCDFILMLHIVVLRNILLIEHIAEKLIIIKVNIYLQF